MPEARIAIDREMGAPGRAAIAVEFKRNGKWHRHATMAAVTDIESTVRQCVDWALERGLIHAD